jgi:hypothetical protein
MRSGKSAVRTDNITAKRVMRRGKSAVRTDNITAKSVMRSGKSAVSHNVVSSTPRHKQDSTSSR